MDTAAHVAEIAEQGYTIVEDAIDPDLVDALAADLERLERDLDVEPATNGFEGEHTVAHLQPARARRSLRADPGARRTCCPSSKACSTAGCLVSSLSSIAIGPGETAQPIHADDQLIPLPKPHPPIVCNTMWALTDFTEANGATRIVPGSHLLDHSPDLRPGPLRLDPRRDGEGAACSSGTASLWHGGGANRTGERRVGIAMNYCAGYIRQQENQQLGIPLEIARRFSPRLRELVGYGIYNGLIGHIDKHDPAELLLEAGEGTSLVWDAV